MADYIKYRATGKPEYLFSIKMSVGVLADHMGFDIEQVDDIKLAVEEAGKAVSCHGMDKWISEYEIECKIEEDRLTIMVRDIGEVGNEIQKTYSSCKNCPEEGNIGMMLLNMLMDKVEIRTVEQHGEKGILMFKNK